MYLAGIINNKLYITSKPVTYQGKQVFPTPNSNVPHLKYFKTTEEIYFHFNLPNPKHTLFLFKTNSGAEIYSLAESEEIARDKAKKYVEERYGKFDYLTGQSEIKCEVTPQGRGSKLIY